jgi:hypothetical protein
MHKVVIQSVTNRRDVATIVGTVDGVTNVATVPMTMVNKLKGEEQSKFLAASLAHQAGQMGAGNALDVKGEFTVSMDDIQGLTQGRTPKSATAVADEEAEAEPDNEN